MNKRIKKLWVDALRSGEYKQGKNMLRDADNKFCCLGVLCNIHAQEHPKIAAAQRNPKSYMQSKYVPAEQVLVWSGLHKDVIEDETPGYDNNIAMDVLARLNDYVDASFEEIADIIEKHL